MAAPEVDKLLLQFAQQKARELANVAQSNVRSLFKSRSGLLLSSIKGKAKIRKRGDIIMQIGSSTRYGNIHNRGGRIEQQLKAKPQSQLKFPRRRPMIGFRRYVQKPRTFMSAAIAAPFFRKGEQEFAAKLKLAVERGIAEVLKFDK